MSMSILQVHKEEKEEKEENKGKKEIKSEELEKKKETENEYERLYDKYYCGDDEDGLSILREEVLFSETDEESDNINECSDHGVNKKEGDELEEKRKDSKMNQDPKEKSIIHESLNETQVRRSKKRNRIQELLSPVPEIGDRDKKRLSMKPRCLIFGKRERRNSLSMKINDKVFLKKRII